MLIVVFEKIVMIGDWLWFPREFLWKCLRIPDELGVWEIPT